MTVMMSRNNTVEFNEGWDIVQKGILKLTEILESDLKDEFSVLEYINIYTIVYKMCTQSSPHCYAQQLYDKYRDSLKEYIALMVLPALGKVHHEFMLRELVKFWGNYNVMVRFMSNMFSYLDIYFVGRRSLSSLIEVGVMCFQDLVYNGIQINVKNVVIELINREREGEQIDGALLRNVLNIFVEIGMDFYKNEFEDSMLEHTGAYYSRKAALWISEESCQNYILKAEECFRHERETVAHYLHSSTEQKLLEKVQNEILSRYQTQILGNEYSGCHALLTDEKKDDLSRMYRLFCTIPKGLKQVANIFKQHVTSQGITLFKCVEDAVNNNAHRSDIKAIQENELVEKIIELHDKCMDYVVDAFQGSSVFYKSLREAFEVICDRRVEESTSAELLATFCDNVLKKSGIVKISDDHIESILEKAANLLEYVSDRDLFGEFYRKKLARRLLFHKSANDSHEQTVLSKLKHQYGSQLTSKMEVMLNDFRVARGTQLDFKTYLHDNSNMHPGLELTVTVLTNGFWPTYKSFELNPPSEMLKCIEVYTGFYSTKYEHRKLTWIYCLGNCKIIGKFDTKPVEIAVSTYQALLLLLFNDSERLSYEDIRSQLNLPEEDVVRLLQSLACGKYKIILKEPSTQTIEKTDRFEFNPDFTCKSTRIKIPFPQIDEKKKVAEVVDGDRCDAIDAAIIRTMKSRKVLRSQELLSECIQQLQAIFRPKVNLMHKRIEELISRDFLELDKENSNIIRYLA